MELQAQKYPDDHIPWVVRALSNAVLQLNGPHTEGIFRFVEQLCNCTPYSNSVLNSLLFNFLLSHVGLSQSTFMASTQPSVHSFCLMIGEEDGQQE